MSAGEWITIIVALLGAVTGMGAMIRQWRRDRPDVAEKYEQMASRQATKIAEMQVTIDRMEYEIDDLKRSVKERDILLDEWQAGIGLLINQLTVRQEKPVWTPKPRATKPAEMTK